MCSHNKKNADPPINQKLWYSHMLLAVMGGRVLCVDGSSGVLELGPQSPSLEVER